MITFWVEVESDIKPPVSTTSKLKRLLVVVKRGKDRYWTVGWFYGGALQEWRIEGSPSNFNGSVTHWKEVEMPS